eukprot:4100755-Alexandrium_andersonii.AAC.1
MSTSCNRSRSTSCAGPHPRAPSQADAPTAMAVARGSRGAPWIPWTTPRAERTITGAQPPKPKAKAMPRLRVCLLYTSPSPRD